MGETAAMGQHRHGPPGAHLGPGCVVRDGVHLYGGAHLGTNVAVGHHSLCRTDVHIGDESQIAHYVSIERGTRLGRYVRSSP